LKNALLTTPETSAAVGVPEPLQLVAPFPRNVNAHHVIQCGGITGQGGSMSAAPAIIPIATVQAVHRRGKSMSRRTGQNGTIEERNGAWRGRYLVDVPGQVERQKRSVVLGFKKDMTRSAAKRKLKEIIRQEGIDLPTYVIPSTENFASQSGEVGRDVRREDETL
jgi:hypothetical protein